MPASRRFHPFSGPLGAGVALLAAGSAAAQSLPSSDAQDWSLCRPNAMLEFFVPDLPRDVVRETAPTDFDADSITIVDRARYRLEGDVIVNRADQRLATKVLSYDHEKQFLEAEGEVRYQDQDILVAADRAQSKLDVDESTLEGVQYQLLSARGNGRAQRAFLKGDAKTELDQVTYSTCDPQQRDWEIVAREIELDHEQGFGTARGMRVKFKDATLLALPWATFPIDDRRRSGFLYPQLGGSNNGGFDLLVPYYLNLAPNYDATLVPRIITDRGLMLGGEFRYLFGQHRGDFSASWLPGDDRADRDRWSYRLDHAGTLSRHFYVVADINRVSDDRYFEDFGDSLSASATSLLPSSTYLYGRGSWWNMSFGGDDIEVTDPRVPPQAEPYRRLPRLTFEAEKPVLDWLALGMRSELVQFDKDDAVSGARYDVQPFVAFPIERAAFFVRPEIAWRSTSYALDDVAPGADDSPSRTTPIASLDAGLFFDRFGEMFGKRVRQTLEPRLYYLHVPYEDQDDLPVFDTQELTFSFAQLFRPNRFSGADRQMDADNLTLALTTRVLDEANGDELVRASIGQVRYFDDQRVQLPGAAPTDYSRSAFAAEVDFRLGERWRVALGQQYDPEDSETDLSAIRVQHRFGERGVANFAYRFRRDFIEQVDASTAFPVSERVRLIARLNYSLRDERTLEALAGVEFESCCYAFRVLGRHYVRNVEGESSNALFLELELKGLGSLGRRSEDFLRRAILGYR